MANTIRHTHKQKKTFYKDVSVTHNRIVYRRNGLILKYGSLTVSKYPFMINMGSVINCYDEKGNYIRKFQCLINGKKTKNYFGFKGTRISAHDFFSVQESNRANPDKNDTVNISNIIANAFKVIKRKEMFNEIKSNYAKGTVLWCNDMAIKTTDTLNVEADIIKETLKNIYNE